MPLSPPRRTAAAALAALALTPTAACAPAEPDPAPATEKPAATPSTATPTSPELTRAFTALEKEFDARLGVYAVHTGTKQTITHRPDTRFAYCSTHKALSVGAVLQRNTPEQMKKVITYTADDVIGHSPITSEHVDTGMPLLDVADAAVRYSDNTAANLLFNELDGPEGFEDAMEAIGDDVIRSDRTETALSEAAPGDDRDTSTPRAMATSLRKFTLGDALPQDRRTVLTDMLIANTTGDETIRAGVPDGWKVGDKTGSGGYGTRNDIALVWPPKSEPIVIAIMSSRDGEDEEFDNALIAKTAKTIAKGFS